MIDLDIEMKEYLEEIVEKNIPKDIKLSSEIIDSYRNMWQYKALHFKSMMSLATAAIKEIYRRADLEISADYTICSITTQLPYYIFITISDKDIICNDIKASLYNLKEVDDFIKYVVVCINYNKSQVQYEENSFMEWLEKHPKYTQDNRESRLAFMLEKHYNKEDCWLNLKK